MKTQNFTPGPWEPEYKSAYQHNVVSHTTPKTIVCTCDVPEYGSKRANFKLIAAAPEMFEALEEMLKVFEPSNDLPVITKASTALQKAKGK